MNIQKINFRTNFADEYIRLFEYFYKPEKEYKQTSEWNSQKQNCSHSTITLFWCTAMWARKFSKISSAFVQWGMVTSFEAEITSAHSAQRSAALPTCIITAPCYLPFLVCTSAWSSRRRLGGFDWKIREEFGAHFRPASPTVLPITNRSTHPYFTSRPLGGLIKLYSTHTLRH